MSDTTQTLNRPLAGTLLEVARPQDALPHTRRHRSRRRRRESHARAGQDTRCCGRVGLGQDDPVALHHGPAARPRRDPRRQRAVRGRRADHDVAPGPAPDLGPGDGDDLPGPDDIAEPGDEDRPPDHGIALGPPRHEKARRHHDGREAAGRRRHSRAGPPSGRVSASAVGRHAPARHHRHRAGLRADTVVRRRTDHRPRRHRSGPDPRPARRAAARPQHVDDPRHPRPRGRGGPDR